MSLYGKITQETIALRVPARNRKEILIEISRRAATLLGVSPHTKEDIYDALLKREKLGSTGVGDGIAIPHCSLPGLEKFIVGLITTEEPIEFHSVDKSNVSVFFYLIGPKDQRNLHISLLSSISKLMIDGEFKKLLLEGTPADEIVRRIDASSDAPPEETPISHEKCLLQVFIQRENLFNEILQIVTSEEENSVGVVESRNVGHYLHSLPLFSAFWVDTPDKFNRMVYGVVNKHQCNDIIRRIQVLSPGSNPPEGVLITVVDLLYSSGTLDF